MESSLAPMVSGDLRESGSVGLLLEINDEQSLTKCGHLGINAQAVLIRKVSAGSFSTKSMYKMPLFIILCKISKQKQSYIQASLRILSAGSTLIS